MEYILSDKIKITRPVIFLCGPYYEKTKSSDRRNILRENIHRIYKLQRQDVLPLIVDLFLTRENIDYEEYSIQLMEEICAAVSYQTHIFLDTMSSAVELGIFANSAYENEICVYIPKVSDVYNQGNVGYFVREAVIKKPGANIQCIEYRPKIVKRAYSSVYIAEHYAFNEDKIPESIKALLTEEAKKNKAASEHKITYLVSSGCPIHFNEICYFESEKKLSVSISIKLLFYIVTSILQQEYPEITKGQKNSLAESELENIEKKIKEAILLSVAINVGLDRKSYLETEISTVLCEDTDIVIKHMIKFILIYYTKSQFKNMLLIGNSAYTAQLADVANHSNIVFDLSKDQMNLVEEICEKPEVYFESALIYSGNKKRKLIKYRDNDNGIKAKQLHRDMNEMFRNNYEHSYDSYAYHKGTSIRKCVECHVSSRWFLKLDIKNFFPSISKSRVLKKLEKDYQVDKRYMKIMEKILSCCFYEDKLPLGLVMSPIISDYFLHEFDADMREYCNTNQLIYTRYADDIMISSVLRADSKKKNDVIDFIIDKLAALDLEINDEKCVYVNFDEGKTFIRYIGVNIVKGEGEKSNYLSVGKKYIFNLAKDYMRYEKCKEAFEDCKETEKKPLETSLFYTRVELIGKIGFIKQIEGQRGLERLATRLRKYYPDVDLSSL